MTGRWAALAAPLVLAGTLAGSGALAQDTGGLDAQVEEVIGQAEVVRELERTRELDWRLADADQALTEQLIKVTPLGDGVYRVDADNVAEGETSRAPAISRAIAKLAELDLSEDGTTVTFPCGSPHDELVAQLTAVLPAESLLHEREDLKPFECDGMTAYQRLPLMVAAAPEPVAQEAGGGAL